MSIFLIIVMSWTEQFLDNKQRHIMQEQHIKVIMCNNHGIKKLGIFLHKVKASGKMQQMVRALKEMSGEEL